MCRPPAALLLVVWMRAVICASSLLSIPPSEFWDGNDGQWSSFHLTIGDPGQLVRVLPCTSATAGTAIWAVLPEGCTQANPGLQLSDCSDSRGGLFAKNSSASWSTERLANDGLYTLSTYEESMLGLAGNAFYGFDAVTLGLPGSVLPTFNNQLVAAFADNDFWLGSLGLSPLPLNFTSLNEPIPSILGTLSSSDLNETAMSTTWAYTAGAVYKDPPVFGSLTFGGYDANRFDADNALSDIPFWADQSRDLLIGLQSITYDTLGSSPLLTEGINIFIDSLVSHIWLPIDACEAFERAFGLEWNDTAQLYLLNDTTHSRLRPQNPTFNFTISASASGGNTTTISIPYAAFDLNVSAPYVNGSVPYFPLKRAENRTQYTLGRVFLQEAYVIADYDRRNFTVAQALFPSTTEQRLETILPPRTDHNQSAGQSLSGGEIAGVVIGGVAFLVAVSALVYWLVRQRRNRLQTAKQTTKPKPELDDQNCVPEVSGTQIYEVSGGTESGLRELKGDSRSELPTGHVQAELPDSRVISELE